MQQIVTSSVDQEKMEVEALVERFARSPRIVELLSHICSKYFAGDLDQLNELQIAIDVFGRPPDFDRSQDAIARVEAHRLRKKLKEFYETEGRHRPVHISLPPGSYIPVFHHQNGTSTNGTPAAVAVESNTPVEAEDRLETRIEPHLQLLATPPRRSRKWLIVAEAIAAAVILVLSLVVLRTHRAAGPPTKAVAATAGTSVRLLCGYSGPPHIGLLGSSWGADRYYIGGRPEPSTQRFTGRTNDPFLFRRIRTGEFSYAIPLAPGTYELHLYFVEASYGEDLGGGEMSRTFLIRLNGKPLFNNFDIVSDAMGPRIADERVIRDVHPDSDGKLHLSFESERGQPIISAIKIVPGLPHKQLPVRIVTQPASFTDHNGHIWAPDNYYLGGQMSMRRLPVSGTPDPDLYASERAGNFTYAIPVDPRGTYTATLHFAETYFGPGGPPNSGIGSRVFNVSCNGVMLLQNFDIYKEAGKCHALTKTFHGLKPTAQGKLVFWFDPVVNYASVFAIEVLDESK